MRTHRESPHPSATLNHTTKIVGRWLFASSLALYVATAGGSLTTTDADVTFNVAEHLVETGGVSVSPGVGGDFSAYRGSDGRDYAPFGLMQSVYDVPFYLVGRAIVRAGLHLGKPDSVPKAVVAMSQTLVSATLVWLIFQLSLLLTGAPVPSLMAAITLAVGSLIWPYSNFGFNQPLAAVALMAALVGVVAGVRHHRPWLILAAGCAFGAGILTRHEFGLAIVPIVVWLVCAEVSQRGEQLRRALLFLPGAAVGLMAWMSYNFARFDNPLNSGQMGDPRHRFMSSIASGLLGLLLSPSTSLLIYSPVAVMGIAGLVKGFRKAPALISMLMALLVAFVLFYATLGNWMGGRSYGARYLYFTLPLLGVGWAAFLSNRRPASRLAWFLAVTVVGMAVQVPGVLADYAKVSQDVAIRDGASATAVRQWEWAASPIGMNTRWLIRAVPENLMYISGHRDPPHVSATGELGDRSFSQQFDFSLDFWWLYLFYLGAIGRAGLLAIVIVLAGTVAACATRLRLAAQSLL